MEYREITTTIRFIVENHDKVIRFFQEMGFHIYHQNISETYKISQMYLNSKSDFKVIIQEQVELDSVGSITMEISDGIVPFVYLKKIFTLKEEIILRV